MPLYRPAVSAPLASDMVVDGGKVPSYPNGKIPLSALSPVPALNDQTAWLLPPVAQAYLAVVAEVIRTHGWAPVITSAGDGFRSYDRQVNVFRQRYRNTYAEYAPGRIDRRVWAGMRYWRWTGAAAAIPGTSNHGLGITVDVSGLGAFTSTRYKQFKAIATKHGFSNAEGASIGEPWHWNYMRAFTVANTNTLPDVTIPTLTTEQIAALERKDNDDMAKLARRANGIDYAIVGPGAQFTTLGDVDQLRTAVGLGMVTGVTVTDTDKGLEVDGDLELLDDLMWNKAQQIAQRWRDQNTR